MSHRSGDSSYRNSRHASPSAVRSGGDRGDRYSHSQRDGRRDRDATDRRNSPHHRSIQRSSRRSRSRSPSPGGGRHSSNRHHQSSASRRRSPASPNHRSSHRDRDHHKSAASSSASRHDRDRSSDRRRRRSRSPRGGHGQSVQRQSRSPSAGSCNPSAPPIPPAPAPPSFHDEDEDNVPLPSLPASSTSRFVARAAPLAHQQRYYAEPPLPGLAPVLVAAEAAEAIENEDVAAAAKQLIQREMQERLKRHLAREGKLYPPASGGGSSSWSPTAGSSAAGGGGGHLSSVFANDGSFLEQFRMMQGAGAGAPMATMAEPVARASAVVAKPAAPVPCFGKRRGGKILKTGIVAKPKPLAGDAEGGGDGADGKKDAWAMYLDEVNKYKASACDTDANPRPLVK